MLFCCRQTKDTTAENKDVTQEQRLEEDDTAKDEGKEAGQRQLHKTLSLFMRSVPPNISKADIVAVCCHFIT